MILRLAAGLLLLLGTGHGLETYHHGKVRDGGVLAPQYFNLAAKSSITTTATCGEDKPELFCKLSAGSDYGQELLLSDRDLDSYGDFRGTGGQFCDICDSTNPSKNHSIEFVKDGTERWWQSPPLSSNTHTRDLNKVNITIDMHQQFHVAYVIIKFANSPRAGKWVLERSVDGINYTPWQYFVNSYQECMFFNEQAVSANERLDRDDDVRCTQDFSDVLPLENGEVIVSLIKGRPGASNFWSSPSLQSWTKASHIRIRLLQAKTLLGHLMGIMENDETVTRRYFYSIKDITIGGRCDCNGHADQCLSDEANDWKLSCQCKHFTMGISCGECLPLYNQHKWQHAERGQINECVKCNCHNHADTCYYDENVALAKASLNMNGEYVGGGVCAPCKHNTEGNNCDRCAPGYYRNQSEPMESEFACAQCDCPSSFTDTSCDHDTGACRCKEKYAGHDCRACAEGFTEFPECGECECHYWGTVNKQCSPGEDVGTCECKENFAGPLCRQCAPGFHSFPDCVPCECSTQPGALTSAACDTESGDCVCKDGFSGAKCEQCSVGFFNYPTCGACSCSAAGVNETICDGGATELSCFCSERFTGSECRECSLGFHSFPECAECACSSPGTQMENGEYLSCEATTGQCVCKPEYTGIACDQCADGFYKTEAGFCLPCECDQDGTKRGTFCDKKTGACQCRDNTSGQRCDECGIGFFNFPGCQKCPCNPAGIYNYDPNICNYFDAGEKCTCKQNVQGRFCDQCRYRFWDLDEANPKGCQQCSCWNDGLLNEIKDCASDSGQCTCKTRVCSQRCSKCEDGFYGLTERNYFGCVGCDCNVGGTIGGALGSTCDKDNGQCQCKKHVTGRKCDTIEEGYCVSSLFQYQFEAEDSFLENGEKVRYGFDKDKFYDYSFRGYAELSDIQSSIKMSGEIEKSSQPVVPMYKLIARIMNPHHQTIRGKLTIAETACVEALDKCDYTFKLTIDTDGNDWENGGLYLDYIALLPNQYYEPKVLKHEVNNPCSYDPFEGEVCMQYDHVDLARVGLKLEDYSPYHLPVTGAFEMIPAVLYDTKPGSTQPFDKMLQIDAGAPTSELNRLYAERHVGREDEYVIVVDYHNPVERRQQMKVGVQFNSGGRPHHEEAVFNIFECDYLFTCRQIGLDRSGAIKRFSLDAGEVYFNFQDDQPRNQLKLFIKAVHLIPFADFDIELLKPKEMCLANNGPKFTRCQMASYPTRPAQAVVLNLPRNDTLSTVHQDVAGTMLLAPQFKQQTFVVEADVTEGTNYIFVVHYHQDDHLTFNATVTIEALGTDLHHGSLPIEYCAMTVGCRSMVDNKGIHAFSISKNRLKISITIPVARGLFVEQIMAIPEPNWSINQLHLGPLDLAQSFINNCGFLIDPSTAPAFCLQAAQSLVVSHAPVRECQCAMAGTKTGTECSPYGCQCACKDNIIGSDCSRCAVGYYGWPECKKCDCIGNTICHEESGECLCPPNTDEKCMACAQDTYGYHHIAGCYECACDTRGTIDHSSSCNLKTGQCSCGDHITGRQCDRCEDGYYGFPNCKKCNCDHRGTVDGSAGQCDVVTGACQCKQNVDGQNCSRCKQGTFYLARDHPDGCITCYCSGLVTHGKNYPECNPSTFGTRWISDMTPGKKHHLTGTVSGWSVQGMAQSDYFDFMVSHRSLIALDVAKGGGQANRVDSGVGSSPKPLYWIAPETYHGNRLGSYGGKLRYSLVWHEEENDQIFNKGFERLNIDPDITLSGGGISIGWVSKDHSTIHNNITIEVTLMETDFYNRGTKSQISREEMLTVLKDLDDIKIKASYPVAVSEILIENVQLQTIDLSDQLKKGYSPDEARPYSFSSRVEVCSCPPGHEGTSCESCSKGYFWDTLSADPSQKCKKCKCNGHCTECDENGFPTITRRGWGDTQAQTGPNEIIYGNYEDYTHVIDIDIIDVSEPDGSGSPVGIHLGRPAHVNDNSKKRCLHHTVGNECELCAPGYIGDATRGTPDDCQRCPCPSVYNSHANSCYYRQITNETDSSSSSSESEVVFIEDLAHYSDGSSAVASESSAENSVIMASLAHKFPENYDTICVCAPGYAGDKCDSCAEGYFGAPHIIGQTCEPCNCNGNSDSAYPFVQCNGLDGTCTACVGGTAGKHCEVCAPFMFGDALSRNCDECACDKCGSVECDGESGECHCKPNVVGEFCDSCAPGFWDYGTCRDTGCRSCDCDLVGSFGPECNQTTGVCDCLPGVDGDKCDACAPGHWDLTQSGCKVCDCPPDTPCDAETGKCFCQEGLVGDRCDQCADPRAVPTKQAFGNTKCQPCDQCVDWLMGPDEQSGVWFNEQDAAKAIQPLTYQVQDTITSLTSTKASQYSQMRYNRLDKKALETRKLIKTHEGEVNDNRAQYLTAKAKFNQTHTELYRMCEDVHELFDQTNSTDSLGNETYKQLIEQSEETQGLIRQASAQLEVIKLSQREESTSFEQRKENMTVTIDQLNMYLENVKRVRAQSNVESELEDARDLYRRVSDIYGTQHYKAKVDEIDDRMIRANDQLDDLKQKIDQTKITTSKADDTLKSLETSVAALNTDITSLEKLMNEALNDMTEGLRLNKESNDRIGEAQAAMDDVEDGTYDYISFEQTELNLQNRIRKMNEVLELVTENATRAEKHSAAIQNMFEGLKVDFPNLENQMKQIKEYNVSAAVRNVESDYIHAHEQVDYVKDVLDPAKGQLTVENFEKLEVCSNDLRLKNNDLIEAKSKLEEKMESTNTLYHSLLADFDQVNEETTALEFNETITEFNKDQFDAIDSLYDNLRENAERLETTKGYLDEYETNSAKIDDALAGVKEGEREIESQVDSLKNDLEAENPSSILAGMDALATETNNTFNEIDDLLLAIKEEIQKTKTLVSEVSRSVKVEYINELTRHDARTLPPDIDLSVSTVVEFSFRLNASTSELITVHDKARAGTLFDIRARDGKLEFTVKLDANAPETKLVSKTVVYDDEWTGDRWFHARASRYGRSAILEVRGIDEPINAAEVVDAELETDNLQWLVSDPEVIIGGDMAKCAVIDIELNDRDINQWLWSDHSANFTNEAMEFDIDEVSQQYHSNKQELTCSKDGGCFTFTGRDSWAHITEKHHSKFLINKKTGTIMLQMKLWGPLQSDGLIFFVGDVEQKDYFMAMEILDAKPRFIYNLNYEKGPQTITLDTDKSLYVKEMSIRIGMVGGVAGLAVQEWHKSKVKPIENDRFLKERSDRCENCVFAIKNEMHFGGIKVLGRDLSHLDDLVKTWNKPYRGCMRPPIINHKQLDFLSETVAKSNIYRGCETEDIRKISFDGESAVRRTNGLGRLNNVIINFGFTLTAGYTSQDATIARFEMESDKSFVEFGMARESHQFYYQSQWEKKKAIKVNEDDLVADTTILVSIERNQEAKSVIITLSTETNTVKTRIDKIKQISQAPGKMAVTFGGTIENNKAVELGFKGCVESAYIDNYKTSSSLPPHRDVFAQFACYKRDDQCFGNVGFNSCPKNQAYRLVQAPPQTRVVEMQRNRKPAGHRTPGKLRVKPAQKCPAFEAPEVDSQGFDFTHGKGVVRFDTRNHRTKLRNDFELSFQLFSRRDGSVMHLVGDSCSQRITFYVANGKLQVSIKIGSSKPIRFIASRKMANRQVPVTVRTRSVSATKNKLIVSVEGRKATKRFASSGAIDIRNLVAGALPAASYRCSSEAFELRNSFQGYMIQPALNGELLSAKRVEDVPTFFGGRQSPGIYLGGTDLDLSMPGGVQTVSFVLKAHQEPNSIMRLKGKDTSIDLKLFNNDVVLVIVKNKIGQKIRLYDIGCPQNEMRILVNIQSDGITLYVNEKQETLKIKGVRVNDLNISGLTGCFTDFKLNDLPLVDENSHVSLEPRLRGNEYSLTTCPQ